MTNTTTPFRIWNIERANCMVGGMPSEFDHSIVTDARQTYRNPLTGDLQPATVYSGTLAECHAWVRAQVTA